MATTGMGTRRSSQKKKGLTCIRFKRVIGPWRFGSLSLKSNQSRG
jgi:hypothetical protein